MPILPDTSFGSSEFGDFGVAANSSPAAPSIASPSLLSMAPLPSEVARLQAELDAMCEVGDSAFVVSDGSFTEFQKLCD